MLLNSISAAKIDAQLMSSMYGFTLQQLMELAGLSVAQAINREYKNQGIDTSNNKILIIVGPGNNGGDGLVAARHLKLFGWNPVVYYPSFSKSITKQPFYMELSQQLEKLFDIRVIKHQFDTDPGEKHSQLSFFKKFSFVVDCIFGFSFKPPIKAGSTFESVLNDLMTLKKSVVDHSSAPYRLISVDIPSGWDVDNGPSKTLPYLKPDMLVSLTYPKQCCKYLPDTTAHYCGGRFISKKFANEFGFDSIEYDDELQVFKFPKDYDF